MDDLRARIAGSLRRERERAGLSASELARRAGVSKGTVSQLENGLTAPNVETLWALGDALGVPFSVFVEPDASAPKLIRAADLATVSAEGAAYDAALLSAGAIGSRRDLYLIQAEPGPARESAPHRGGTVEHVILVSGSAEVGPSDQPVLLEPGDYLTYPGDAPHVFRALVPGTRALLLSDQR